MKNIAKRGDSGIACRVALGISKDVWYRLQSDHEEFSDTVQECETLCQLWWERHGRKMSMDGKGSAVAWKFNMQNRFNWREKNDTNLGGQPGNPIGIDLSALTEEELELAEKLANAARSKQDS